MLSTAPTARLMQGDCIELMKRIPDKSIDMILCDLPYGVTARNKWDIIIPFEDLWEQYERIVKDSAAIILFGHGMFTAELMFSNKKLWRYNLIWEKTQPTGFLNAKRMPMRSHEDICVFYKSLPEYYPQKTTGHERKYSTVKHKHNSKMSPDYGEYKLSTYDSTERYPLSILKYPPEDDTILTYSKDVQKSALHPTQKPVALCEHLIRSYTAIGEVVLDNTMGSGSTGVAAIQSFRNFIGIEKDPKIFAIARERIMNVELPLCI